MSVRVLPGRRMGTGRHPPVDVRAIVRGVSVVAGPLASRGRRATLGLLLCSDREIAALDRRWLGREGPTNVISFSSPVMDDRERRLGPTAPVAGTLDAAIPAGAPPLHLGDVAVSVDTALREAGPRGRDRRILYLSLHGLLHVLGWDHGDDASWRRMHVVTMRLVRAARRHRG